MSENQVFLWFFVFLVVLVPRCPLDNIIQIQSAAWIFGIEHLRAARTLLLSNGPLPFCRCLLGEAKAPFLGCGFSAVCNVARLCKQCLQKWWGDCWYWPSKAVHQYAAGCHAKRRRDRRGPGVASQGWCAESRSVNRTYLFFDVLPHAFHCFPLLWHLHMQVGSIRQCGPQRRKKSDTARRHSDMLQPSSRVTNSFPWFVRGCRNFTLKHGFNNKMF